jgi:hypothetical protein
MLIRSFGNGFEIQDWTEEVSTIQNQWGTINSLGIFQEVPVAEHVIAFESRNENGGVIVDRVRGDRNNVGKDSTRKIHTMPIPHFPLIDQILPQDVQGKRAYGSASDVETLANKRTEKMEYIRKAHARTLEIARAQAIVSATAYAPNGTISLNYNTQFGVTRTTVPFVLGTAGTDVLAKVEGVIASVQDNAGSTSITGIVGMCSPGFFAALIAHASIRTAYQYYASTAEPLRQRQAAGGSAVPLQREFYFGGIRFIEMRDAFGGTPLITANEAFFVPTGTDAFKTYFGPANKFGIVNTLGMPVYLFENASTNGSSIELESESNHLSALLRPELVIRGTVA